MCPQVGRTGPSEETLRALRLHLSELRLAGVGRNEALELCAKLYDEGEQE